MREKKLFGLYSIGGQEIVDTKSSTLLAESLAIGFSDIKLFEYVRRNIFFLITGNGNSMINVHGKGYHSNEIWLKLVWNRNIK